MIVKGNKIIRHGFGAMEYQIELSYQSFNKRKINVKYIGHWHDDQMNGKGKYE